VSARREGETLVLAQRRFNYLPEPPPPARAEPEPRWQIPVQVRVLTPDGAETRRVLLTDREARVPLPAGTRAVVVNEGGHGFYRARYEGPLREAIVAHLDALSPIERFNLVNDAWAVTVAGHMALEDYLDLTARFRGERDKNVWSALAASLHSLNRIVNPTDRPRLEALVRDRAAPALADLGWSPRAGEDELTGQLRADLVRLLGTLGNDPVVQRRAGELYAAALTRAEAVDPNVLPALIAVLAHAGDEKRYAEFLERFRAAATPQEEQRYLYALAAFQSAALVEQTLARTVNGEVRTQDAPFVVRTMLTAVNARELAWAFVKSRWDVMDRLYPKQGLRRMCEGVIGLATPALEADVHRFFTERKVDLGGKTLQQYLEQLRVAIALREREGNALAKHLARFA
jgi:puromycin-sensitive aminopeptidase